MEAGTIKRRQLLAGVAGLGVAQAVDESVFCWALAPGLDSPVAATEYGKIRGVAALKVLSFRGVPYGGTVDGTNRFMPPTKPIPWKGIRDTTQAGPRAIQAPDDPTHGERNVFSDPQIGSYFSGGRADALRITAEPQNENCLVLNILTPSLKGDRAVMVYIHGGGFTSGSGALTLISDRFVLEQDVVLVGINHRLNAFGYTYLGDIDPDFQDSGNVGQLDLVQALQWVNANITNFGGDPGNVTVFGESGGGAKISCLMAMPAAIGLFHRAIIQSGSSRSVNTKDMATEQTRRMMAALRVTTVADLQTVPAHKLYAAARQSGPVLDGRSLLHQTWTPSAPPEAAGVALLVGNCKDESTLFSLKQSSLYRLDWAQLKEQISAIGMSSENVITLVAQYRADFPQDNPTDIYFRMSSDRGARANAISQAELQLAQTKGGVYMYHFAWDTPVVLDGKRFKAFHTSDLPLEMRLVAYPQAEELSKQLAGAWASFARTGNPNHPGLPHWERYSTDKRSTMIFDVGKTTLVDRPDQRQLALLAPFGTPLL